MVEISDVSTDMRSLRSKRVGPLTESEIPIEKKENQSRKVRHRAGHGYEGAVISTQFKESVETVTQRQGLVSSGGEYKEQMRGSQLTKNETMRSTPCGQLVVPTLVANQNAVLA